MVRPKPEDVTSKYNVPFCAFGQDLERAAVRSTRLNSPDDFTFSPPGPLPEERRDPRPDEVSRAKAQGLCQTPVSMLPSRYGLFRVIADKLSHLRGVPATASASAKDGMAEFIADPKMKACVSNTMNSQMKSFAEFNQVFSEIEVKAIDPDIQEEAQEFVKGLKEMKCPLSNDESEFLEKAVAFAMQAGISADELAEAANIIMINDGAPGIFAYKFLTIVSLDIARKFHRASKAEYSAGFDRYVDSIDRFDRFVETVESAVFKGDIEVGVMDLSEIVATNSGAGALYYFQEDKIKFRPIDKNTSFLQIIENVVHESYHAYQDSRPGALPAVQAESEASLRGKKTYLALEDDIISRLSVEDLGSYMGLAQKLTLNPLVLAAEQMRCMGYPDDVISAVTTLNYSSQKTYMAWMAVADTDASASAAGAQFTQDLFAEYFGPMSYIQRTSGSEINNMNMAWDMTQKMKPDEIKKQLASLISQLPGYWSAIFKTRMGSLASGAAVDQYLSVYNMALSIAYYSNKDVWKLLLNKNLEQRDFLNESLLYVPFFCDGIGKTPAGQRK